MSLNTFENVRDQIGFCGIYCGSCTAGNGAILDLARKFEEIAKRHRLEKWAPKDFNFNEFMKGLASIQSTPLCPGCRKGGGNPTWKIRICALQKTLADCSQCSELSQCRNFEQIEESHPRIRQDLVVIKGEDRTKLINKWVGGLKTKWPHCILLCESTKP